MGKRVAPEKLKACIPIIIPAPFSFQGIHRLVTWLPPAVVMHGGLESTAIAARYIPNDAINVEKQDCLWL